LQEEEKKKPIIAELLILQATLNVLIKTKKIKLIKKVPYYVYNRLYREELHKAKTEFMALCKIL